MYARTISEILRNRKLSSTAADITAFVRATNILKNLQRCKRLHICFSRAWCIRSGSIPGARTFADGHSLGLYLGIWRNYAAARQTASRKQSRLICFGADARHAEKFVSTSLSEREAARSQAVTVAARAGACASPAINRLHTAPGMAKANLHIDNHT